MDLVRQLIYLGLGAASMTKDKIEAAIRDVVEHGEVTQEEGRALAAELVERGRKQKEDLVAFISKEVDRLVRQMPFATKSDLEDIESRIQTLERKSSGE